MPKSEKRIWYKVKAKWDTGAKKTYMAETTGKLKEILLYLKWGNISKDYFGFSRGWIYQRLNGYDGNGNECDFTEAQKETLREALRDIARKLDAAADNI